MLKVVLPKAETFRNTRLLGDWIRKSYGEEGLDLPVLTFLSRGGLEIAGTLCRHLNVGAADILHAGADRIEDEGQPPRFEVGQFPTADQVENRHLLLIDVVCRSGEKMGFVADRLSGLGAASVRSAVIYDMTPLGVDGQPNPDQFVPDHSLSDGRNMGHAVFHWEYEEMIVEGEARQRTKSIQALADGLAMLIDQRG